jgi:fused signal recognition particle receptor
MFGLLKNKLASFVKGLVGKEEEKGEAAQAVPEPAKEEAKPSHPAEKAEVKPASQAAKPMPPPVQKQPELDLSKLEKKAAMAPEKREVAPKIGLGTAIKSFFSSDITIGESEVSDLLSELELSLLEADVAYDVSLDVTAQLRGRLVGMKVPKGKVEERTRQAIEEVLSSVMTSDRKFDLVERVCSLPKPAKILFVGPNGAGKTTTMAKVAHMLMSAGLTCVFSASDTFRAAAIEQTEVHAGRLGVKVVKSKYGADPASVAFDAVNFARTHNIDAVLIDSAGRQDTNANLLDELKKISRVTKPDVKIYIGESIGGNALLDQVRAFDEAIGMDGAILTKIDCDAKGGTALSLTKSTGIPVLYMGVGQAYADLVPFEPGRIAQEIMN